MKFFRHRSYMSECWWWYFVLKILFWNHFQQKRWIFLYRSFCYLQKANQISFFLHKSTQESVFFSLSWVFYFFMYEFEFLIFNSPVLLLSQLLYVSIRLFKRMKISQRNLVWFSHFNFDILWNFYVCILFTCATLLSYQINIDDC